MPFQKGHKLSPGRTAGVKNKRSLKVIEMASQFDLDPFEILMHIAQGDWEALGYQNEIFVKETADGKGHSLGYTITPEMRLAAAKECAQYLYAKKREEDPEAKQPLEAFTLEEKRLFLAQAKEEIKKLEAEIEERPAGINAAFPCDKCEEIDLAGFPPHKCKG